jgi:hypothetical protein
MAEILSSSWYFCSSKLEDDCNLNESTGSVESEEPEVAKVPFSISMISDILRIYRSGNLEKDFVDIDEKDVSLHANGCLYMSLRWLTTPETLSEFDVYGYVS